MAEEETKGSSSPSPPRLSYFEYKRTLKRLERFQNLIAHRGNCAINLQLVPPIEQLLPKIPEQNRHSMIDREIKRLMFVVHHDFSTTNISTTLIYRPVTGVETKYDLVLDYFDLLGSQNIDGHASLMLLLENCIGIFQDRKRKAFSELFNPLTWLALGMRAPISILEKAGLADDNTRSLVVKMYSRIMQTLMFLIIAFLATKLGVSIQWQDIFTKIIKLISAGNR